MTTNSRKNRHRNGSSHSRGSLKSSSLAVLIAILCTQRNCIGNNGLANAELMEAAGTLTAFGPGQSAYSYRAQIVYFEETVDSLRLPPYHRLGSNLMVPPGNNSQLCEYPIDAVEEYIAAASSGNLFDNEEATTNNSDYAKSVLPVTFEYSPLTLVVSPGGCSIMQKIKVALQIKQNITGDVWSILFFSNDTTHGDNWITPLAIPEGMNGTTVPGLDSLILTAVSRSSGDMIMDQIDRVIDWAAYREFESSPVLLTGPGNDRWRLPLVLERGNDSFSNDDTDEEDEWQTSSLLWFRLVLFLLIFCFPVVRALRSWHVRGGRILFDRNESGRIIGITVQPPTRGWGVITNDGGQGNRSRVHSKLTNEQVMELLPEISYTAPPFDEDIVVEGETYFGSHSTSSNEEDESDIQIAVGTDDVPFSRNGNLEGSSNSTSQETPAEAPTTTQSTNYDVACQDQGNPSNSESAAPTMMTASSPINYDEETGSHHDQANQDMEDVDGDAIPIQKKKVFNTTISTTCSICIEEFEEGEKIRLLPRCGHGYHTECILPWLTERQGCCPLCKANVLGSGEDGEVEGSDAGTAEPDASRPENGSRTNAEEEASIPIGTSAAR